MPEKMLERLLDIKVTEQGTIIEEIELICTMTGFRRRFLVEHTIDRSSYYAMECFRDIGDETKAS